jgi:hypothetical protein
MDSLVGIFTEALSHAADFGDVLLILFILGGGYVAVALWKMLTGERGEVKKLSAKMMTDCKDRLDSCMLDLDELEERIKHGEARLLTSLRMQIKAQGIYEESIRGVGRIFPPKLKECPGVCPVRSALPDLLEEEVQRVSKAIEELAPRDDD